MHSQSFKKKKNRMVCLINLSSFDLNNGKVKSCVFLMLIFINVFCFFLRYHNPVGHLNLTVGESCVFVKC